MGSFEVTHLLDTHTWVQSVAGAPLPPLVEETLDRHARSLAIADISLWEVAKLFEDGRLELSVTIDEFLEVAISPVLTILPITSNIARRVAELEQQGFHKDPADQLIVATALVHSLTLISNDTRIRQWRRVPMLWRSANS